MPSIENFQEVGLYKGYSILMHQETQPTTADVYVAVAKLEGDVYKLAEASTHRNFPLYDGILNHMLPMVSEA